MCGRTHENVPGYYNKLVISKIPLKNIGGINYGARNIM